MINGIRGEPAATILLGFLKDVKHKSPEKLFNIYNELAPRICEVNNEADEEAKEKGKIALVHKYKNTFKDFADLEGFRQFKFSEILDKAGYEPVIFKIVQYLCWFIDGWGRML